MTPCASKNPAATTRATAWFAALAVVLLCHGALAATNDHYKNAMSADLHKNCKSFSIASDGVLTGVCNSARRADNRGNTWWETASKTIDLDSHVGNVETEKTGLTCGQTNVSGDCRNLSVGIHANGVDLTAQCTYKADGKTSRVNKTINLNACIKCDTSNNGDLIRR